jgi:hypothetical protein
VGTRAAFSACTITGTAINNGESSMGNAELKLGIAERMNKQENEAKFVKSLFQREVTKQNEKVHYGKQR